MKITRIAGKMALIGLGAALWIGFGRGQPAFSEDEINANVHKVATFALSNYPEQMKALQTLSFDIAGVDFKRKTVDLVVDQKELSYARELLQTEELKISEVNKKLAPDDGYHTPDEVEQALTLLAEEYGHIARLESIGVSNEGKSIWAMKISDHPLVREHDEPTILFNAMHHAREVMTTEVAMDTITYLLEHYGSDDRVTNWVDQNEIWVVPMLNPDGNDKVWHADSMWRKNTRGGYGVDINRNYPYNWNRCGGSSGYRYSESYRGPSAASEPETNALMNLVARIQPVFNISYHSYSEMVLYPYGCAGQHTPNREIVAGIGAQLAKLLPSDDNDGSTYIAGTPWEILYSVDGGDIDWMYHEHGVLPYVIELNSRRLGFQPSYRRWRNVTVEKSRAGWAYLLDRLSGPGVRGHIALDSERLAEVAIRVKALNNDEGKESRYTVKADGTYHIVLLPGTYKLTYQFGEHETVVRTVTITDERIALDIAF